MAVRGGIASALMAKRGITGARNCFGRRGRDVRRVSRPFLLPGKTHRRARYALEGVNVSIKPYPCCRGVHPSIDAALTLVRKYDVRPDDVKGIVIYCGEATYGLLALLSK